jgi:hypothetical protein
MTEIGRIDQPCKARRSITRGCLLTMLCLVLPTASAYAQVATGFVSCDQINDWGDSSVTYAIDTVVYPVTLDLNSFLIANRWGDGLNKDVQYEAAFGTFDTTKKYTTYNVYIFSVSDPAQPATFEQLYSETGKLMIRVARDNSMSITGKTFAVTDRASLRVLADCTWTLKGTMTANP